jgi:hypothetical protein
MNNDMAWRYWEQALENPKALGKEFFAYPDDPQVGFYKARYEDRPWESVAIFWHEGKLIGLRGGEPVKAAHMGTLWNWCCRNPISEEEYKARLAGTWAGDDPVVVSMIGHNAGDDLEMLRDQIAAAEAGADAYRGINSDEQAGRAQSLRARLNELAGEADKRREALKKPHFEAGKAIDKDWMPLVKSAKAIADWIKEEITAYETLKLRERRRLEEERQRLEQERLREEERVAENIRRAEEAGRPVVVPPAPPPLPPLPPAPDTKLKGSYGRAASVTTEKVVTAVGDWDALFGFLRDHPELQKLMRDLAQRLVKAGHDVPGVTIQERARIS